MQWHSQQEEDLKLQCQMMLWLLLGCEILLHNQQHEMQASAHQNMQCMLLGDEWKQQQQGEMISILEQHKNTTTKNKSDMYLNRVRPDLKHLISPLNQVESILQL